MEKAKAIIDYAQDDNGTELRNALYGAIQDKVMAHLEAERQRVAQSLITQPEQPDSMATAQDTPVENT